MRAALAGLLGCALGAPGREIPVYREYTQPISFYDEDGEREEFHEAGLDQSMLRSLKDAQAQEGMLGRETVLQMTLVAGDSVFGKRAKPVGMGMPIASGAGEDGRRKKDGDGQNWLAKSLVLPSLGQMPTNAAMSVMSAGSKESSWGWLAEEVAGQDGQENSAAQLLEQEEEGAFAGLGAGAAEEDNPYLAARDATEKADEKLEALEAPGAFPDDGGEEQKPSTRAVDRGVASGRELQGGDRTASPTMKDYRSTPVRVEMGQTRQLLAEYSAGARPDFAQMRESLGAAVIAGSGGGPGERPEAAPPKALDLSLAGLKPELGKKVAPPATWGAGGGASSAVSVPAWQGGWNAQQGGAASRTPQFGGGYDPVPLVVPAAKATPVRSGPASGGYKPAWY